MSEEKEKKRKAREVASVSMTKSVFDLVADLAETEDRTVSNMIAQLVTDGLKYRNLQADGKIKA